MSVMGYFSMLTILAKAAIMIDRGVTMIAVNATEIKNKFGEFLEKSRNDVVAIDKNSRRVAVMLSWDEYERLSALEDDYWGREAKKAEGNGYVGPEVAMEFLRSKMNEKA